MPIEHPAVRAASDRTPGAAVAGHASKSKRELYDEAKNADIEGRSAMSKEELIEALGRHNATSPASEGPALSDVDTAPAVRRREDARNLDRCAIVYHRSGRHGEFQVVVTEADGSRRSVARSPAFRAPRAGAVRRRGAARAAHDLLVRRLEACGWWPAGSGGRWYELGFVRLRTAGKGSVRSVVTVVRDARQARFVAEELDTYGNPTPLLVSRPFSVPRVRPPRPTSQAKAALKELVTRMERKGWNVAEAIGEERYPISLPRRPVAGRRTKRSE